MKLMEDESKHAEKHQVALDADLNEVMTLIRGHADKLQRNQLTSKDGTFDMEQHTQVRMFEF